MSKEDIVHLENKYHDLQEDYLVETGDSHHMAKATKFSLNQNLPVHRWFHFKEGFSANYLSYLGVDTSKLNDENSTFLDPFCGCGTSLLAGDIQYQWQSKRIGIEINPFLAFVSQTKMDWRKYNPDNLNQLGEKILSKPLQENISSDQMPRLSTFHNPEMFNYRTVSKLVDAVNRVSKVNEIERNIFLLGIASVAEQVSYFRKDGRALRRLRSRARKSERDNIDISKLLIKTWEEYEHDIRLLQQGNKNINVGNAWIIRGDGRKVKLYKDLETNLGHIQLIAYSPPYLNHIDYTEVYKIELWLLGFIKSHAEMLSLRKQTMRSHASINFPSHGFNFSEEFKEIIELTSNILVETGTKWHLRFRDTAYGYFEDMKKSLARQFQLISSDGLVICIVANSLHGSKNHRVPVVSDLLIAKLARDVGFKIEKILITRKMPRRDIMNGFSRESAIILRK